MRKVCMTRCVAGLALLAVFYCVGAGAAMATTPTLTHQWKFDGNFNDTGTVGGKTADPLSTGTAVSGTGGIAGGAATFDGVNDLLYIPATTTGSGTEEDPYGITDSPLPAGPFTLSFWEYCTSPTNAGYFVSDAAVTPEYNFSNLIFRRRPADWYTSDGSGLMKSYSMTGLKSETIPGHPDPGYDSNYWVGNYTRFNDSLNPELPDGEWVHHVITYSQSNLNGTPSTTGGWGVWYVNGQISTWGLRPDTFTGLMPLQELDPYPAPEFEWSNRRPGMVIGNLIDNTNVAEFDALDPYHLVGPVGNYQGKIDEFQIYNGWVNPDQARYLHENPGATLATYTAPAASTQPKNAQKYHWKFDGNMNEEGGSGYNGAAIGNAATTTGGIAGGCVQFDGIDDAVSISQNVIGAGAFSIVFWAKDQVPVTATGVDNPLASYDYLADSVPHPADPPAYTNLALESFNCAYKDSGVARDVRDYASRLMGVTSEEFAEDGPSLTNGWDFNNQWRQHAYVVNADGDVQWFVNNQLMNHSAAFPFQGLLGDLYLGNSGTLGRDFKGYIDDLQIYNWDINATDVAWLWNNAGQSLTITGGTPVYQPYDVNEDGFVGADDLDVVRAHWGESGPGGKAIGDINLDEFVGADDLDQLRAHWGEVCPPIPGLVPEPSAFVLLLMGALALIAVRRVR